MALPSLPGLQGHLIGHSMKNYFYLQLLILYIIIQSKEKAVYYTNSNYTYIYKVLY